jgi:membrane-bound ClpP family serine protease
MEYLFGGYLPWFTVPALIGTALFVVRVILMLAGTSHDFHADVTGGDIPDGHDFDSTNAFHILSIQTVASFLMGYGWTGFASFRTFEGNFAVAIPFALLGGVAFVWMLAILLKAANDLQASGNIKISEAIGLEGSVDVKVPKRGSGTGRVRLVISNRLREYNAVTEGDDIVRGTRVRVTKAEGSTLTVTSAQA